MNIFHVILLLLLGCRIFFLARIHGMKLVGHFNATSPVLWAIGYIALLGASIIMEVSGSPEPCEIVTKRRLEPGKVIECPTQDTSWGCDTTYYYRLP